MNDDLEEQNGLTYIHFKMLNETWIYLFSQQIITDHQLHASHLAITSSSPLSHS